MKKGIFTSPTFSQERHMNFNQPMTDMQRGLASLYKFLSLSHSLPLIATATYYYFYSFALHQ
jgi:hypothetical protein